MQQKKTLRIVELVLTHFRNYEYATLRFGEGVVVLTGQNGAGKTNILEAVSFLSPGKGLRNLLKLSEADRAGSPDSSWTVSAQIHGVYGSAQIGTGRDPSASLNRRVVKIDGKMIGTQATLAELFSVMWLTPQMDGLFLQASSERRRFMDRLVYNFNPEHASHIYSYEYHMRERAKLLQDNADPLWLALTEAKMAERAVAIAAARIEGMLLIQHAMDRAPTVFPKAIIQVDGQVETWLNQYTALQTEELFKEMLCQARSQDALSRRTRYGVHRSDLIVFHAGHHMPASFCSTGEQKALLLAILLAEARAKIHWREVVPVLLLDEVVAHLDYNRRQALYDELLEMKCQVFMTGTDDVLFEPLKAFGQFVMIREGRAVTA